MDERQVKLEGAYNFRDIGGYEGKDHRKVAFKKLYRSDELSKLTDADVLKLEAMGLKTIIDYRGERERFQNENKAIQTATIYYLDPKADVAAWASSESGDKEMKFDLSDFTAAKAKKMMIDQNEQFVLADSSKKAYRAMFDLMLDEKNLPIVQHCRGGKDRTGYGIALILLVLGVSREDVMQDYLLTNVYKKEKNERSLNEMLAKTHNEDLVLAMRYMKEANVDFIMKALDTIDEKFGGIDNYVRQELSLSEAEIQKLQDIYLERDENE